MGTRIGQNRRNMDLWQLAPDINVMSIESLIEDLTHVFQFDQQRPGYVDPQFVDRFDGHNHSPVETGSGEDLTRLIVVDQWQSVRRD